MWALFSAALAGAAMAFQGALNARLGKQCGVLEASWIVHLLALALLAGLLFVLRLGKGRISAASGAPWYTFLGGPLNVLIIYLVISSIPKVGVAPATTAIITAQVFTASLIDHLGLLEPARAAFSFLKVLGFLLLAAGTWLLLAE